MATIRLINSGVFDRHPNLTVHMSHLGGGLSALLGRIRSYQDKDFWGTLDNARHGMKPKQDFDYYLRNNMVFDTAGFCGAMGAVKGALIEIPASRIVFATDYPQEIRERARGARLRQGAARARQGRRGNPLRQRRQAPQAAGQGGITAVTVAARRETRRDKARITARRSRSITRPDASRSRAREA